MNPTLFGLIVGLLCLAGFVQSLRYQDVEEGPCLNIPPARNLNLTWMENTIFEYISAGSKYHLYRIASFLPRFSKSREFEFYYDVCLQNELSFPKQSASAVAFGERLPTAFAVRPVSSQLNTYDFVPGPNSVLGETARHTVVLTDNRSFVLFNNCWKGSNQRGWNLISTTAGVDERTQALIEDYMEMVGFDRKKFVFLKYETCNISPKSRNRAAPRRYFGRNLKRITAF